MELKSHTTDEIVKAAKDVAAWCELRWDAGKPSSSLRNLDFSPQLFGTDHYYTVNDIIFSRRYEMERLGLAPARNLTEGRILVYEPDMNVSDGLSEHETGGYLDANDCPPWDTWIGYVTSCDRRYVLSWVPNSLVHLIDAGAEVNCVDCFYWLSNVTEPWAMELNNA